MTVARIGGIADTVRVPALTVYYIKSQMRASGCHCMGRPLQWRRICNTLLQAATKEHSQRMVAVPTRHRAPSQMHPTLSTGHYRRSVTSDPLGLRAGGGGTPSATLASRISQAPHGAVVHGQAEAAVGEAGGGGPVSLLRQLEAGRLHHCSHPLLARRLHRRNCSGGVAPSWGLAGMLQDKQTVPIVRAVQSHEVCHAAAGSILQPSMVKTPEMGVIDRVLNVIDDFSEA